MDLEHEKRLTEVEERAKSNTKRLGEIEKRQDNLDEIVGTVKVLADREERVENDVKEIKSDVKILTNKPAQKWESTIEKIIGYLIAGLIGFLFSKIGM